MVELELLGMARQFMAFSQGSIATMGSGIPSHQRDCGGGG